MESGWNFEDYIRFLSCHLFGPVYHGQTWKGWERSGEKGLIIISGDNQDETWLIITINDTSSGDLPLIITISDMTALVVSTRSWRPHPLHVYIWGCWSLWSVDPCLDILRCVETLPHLLVWASVRVLGAGRVEQRSSGGCWAQGVCRGQSNSRGAREGRGVIFAEFPRSSSGGVKSDSVIKRALVWEYIEKGCRCGERRRATAAGW